MQNIQNQQSEGGNFLGNLKERIKRFDHSVRSTLSLKFRGDVLPSQYTDYTLDYIYSFIANTNTAFKWIIALFALFVQFLLLGLVLLKISIYWGSKNIPSVVTSILSMFKMEKVVEEFVKNKSTSVIAFAVRLVNVFTLALTLGLESPNFFVLMGLVSSSITFANTLMFQIKDKFDEIFTLMSDFVILFYFIIKTSIFDTFLLNWKMLTSLIQYSYFFSLILLLIQLGLNYKNKLLKK